MTKPNDMPALESWKSIKEYEGIYSISNIGRVRRDSSAQSTYGGRILIPVSGTCNYYRVKLYKNGKYKRILVHILVAKYFIGLKPMGMVVNHKDGNKFNNHLNNLEYITALDNYRHAWKLGLFDKNLLRGNNRTVAQKTGDKIKGYLK